jgi:hypothetical protein
MSLGCFAISADLLAGFWSWSGLLAAAPVDDAGDLAALVGTIRTDLSLRI